MKQFILMMFTLGALAAWAQPEPMDEEGAPPPPPGSEGMRPPPAEGPEGLPPPPIQVLMQHWKKQNPEEFERMQKLREEDPEAFRRELHRKLEKAREDRGLGRRGGPGGRGLPEGDLPPPDPRLQAAEESIRDLVRQWRAATNEEARLQVRTELQSALSQAFDLREQARRERLAQMEKKMAELRSSLEQRRQQRAAIIEKRMRELTEGDPLAW